MIDTLRRRGDEGFTLIELLIVIIILAILAAIVVFAVGSTSNNATVSACKADKKSLETAVEAYKAQQGSFPGSTTVLTQTQTDPNNSLVTDGPWLRELPSNPSYTLNYSSSSGAITVTLASGVSGTC